MLTMSTTALVVYIGILALAIYDLGVVVFKGTGSSVSQFLIKSGWKSQAMILAFGITIGHLWMVMHDTDCAFNWAERAIIAVCGYGFFRGLEFTGVNLYRALK